MENVLWNGNMFLRKKIQPILGVEVVKPVSLIIDGGNMPYGSKIKHNGLKNFVNHINYRKHVW